MCERTSQCESLQQTAGAGCVLDLSAARTVHVHTMLCSPASPATAPPGQHNKSTLLLSAPVQPLSDEMCLSSSGWHTPASGKGSQEDIQKLEAGYCTVHSTCVSACSLLGRSLTRPSAAQKLVWGAEWRLSRHEPSAAAAGAELRDPEPVQAEHGAVPHQPEHGPAHPLQVLACSPCGLKR